MFSGCAFVVWLCCGIRNNGTVTLWNLDWYVEFIGKLSYRGDSVKSGYWGVSTRTVIAFHVLWALFYLTAFLLMPSGISKTFCGIV